MTSLRDAHKRLELIYQATAADASEQMDADKSLDEFSRLKKKIHQEMKKIREALKERDLDLQKGGNQKNAAEASYRIRVMIKTMKESITRMEEVYDKQARKKKQKDAPKIENYKETLDLCKQHLEEVEALEKKRVTDGQTQIRADLFKGANSNTNFMVNIPKDGNYEVDPYTTELPDIDVEEDLQEIKRKDEQIDEDVKELGKGVSKLRDIAIQMGNELDKQKDDLDRLEKGVDKATDHVDNINVALKNTVEKASTKLIQVMAGDRFMVNAILLCVILALGAFIVTRFVEF